MKHIGLPLAQVGMHQRQGVDLQCLLIKSMLGVRS